MTLLSEVRHGNSGLEGTTEDGEKVLLSEPFPLVMILECKERGETLREALLKKLRGNKQLFYQVTGTPDNIPGTNYRVIPYNEFTKRRV